ncbi:MAG: NTP transferase domain-containing protein [Candidatus Fermentibacteraceae bacterium]
MAYHNKLSYLSPSPIVLAAGGGRRMGGVEKACLKVGGRSLLERHFGNFAALGVTADRVSVVYGTEGVRLETERLGGRPVKSGLPGAPGTLGSFMAVFPSGECLVVHGDLLWEPSMAFTAMKCPGDAVIPVDPLSVDREAMKAEVYGGLLVRLSKDLKPAECSGESMGMFLFRGHVLPDLRACCTKAAMEFGCRAALDDAVTFLAQVRKVAVVFVPGSRWDEIDTPDDLARAERVFNG